MLVMYSRVLIIHKNNTLIHKNDPTSFALFTKKIRLRMSSNQLFEDFEKK